MRKFFQEARFWISVCLAPEVFGAVMGSIAYIAFFGFILWFMTSVVYELHSIATSLITIASPLP